MKKQIFSGLIFCSFLMAAAQTNGQTVAFNNAPVITNAPAPPLLYAAIQNDNTNQHVVILHWSTRDQGDIDRYLIEKSTDSILFNPLEELIPQNATDDTGDSVYRDEDPFPANQTNYYRLAAILKDGNTLYSPVIRVNVDMAQTPLLRPVLLNVNGILRMDNFYQQPLIVDLFDEGGAHIASYAANSAAFNINTAGLNSSTLVYRISDEHHAFLNAGKILLQ